jgi:hypothetical protein
VVHGLGERRRGDKHSRQSKRSQHAIHIRSSVYFPQRIVALRFALFAVIMPADQRSAKWPLPAGFVFYSMNFGYISRLS